MPGRPVLTCWMYFAQQLRRNLRLDPEHELLALFLGLDGLRRKLRDIGDKVTLAGITYCGAASSTRRTSAPMATRPACAVGRKNVM